MAAAGGLRVPGKARRTGILCGAVPGAYEAIAAMGFEVDGGSGTVTAELGGQDKIRAKFNHITESFVEVDDILASMLEESPALCVVLLGPSGAGKTTYMCQHLKELLCRGPGSKEVEVRCVEINEKGEVWDLVQLDGVPSGRGEQARKEAMVPRLATGTMFRDPERLTSRAMMASTPKEVRRVVDGAATSATQSNSKSSRHTILLELSANAKRITAIDLPGHDANVTGRSNANMLLASLTTASRTKIDWQHTTGIPYLVKRVRNGDTAVVACLSGGVVPVKRYLGVFELYASLTETRHEVGRLSPARPQNRLRIPVPEPEPEPEPEPAPEPEQQAGPSRVVGDDPSVPLVRTRKRQRQVAEEQQQQDEYTGPMTRSRAKRLKAAAPNPPAATTARRQRRRRQEEEEEEEKEEDEEREGDEDEEEEEERRRKMEEEKQRGKDYIKGLERVRRSFKTNKLIISAPDRTGFVCKTHPEFWRDSRVKIYDHIQIEHTNKRQSCLYCRHSSKYYRGLIDHLRLECAKVPAIVRQYTLIFYNTMSEKRREKLIRELLQS